MTHELNTRMRFLRAAGSDPRLTGSEQRVLQTLVTYMPFEEDEGWVLSTEAIAQDIYSKSGNTQKQNVRKTLSRLESKGFIQRVYAGSRMDMHRFPTFFVNWDRLLEPFRQAKIEGSTRVEVTRQTSQDDSLFLISSLKYPETAPSGTTMLEVVR